MSGKYKPGACNIGQPERQMRYAFGILSFIIAAGFVIAVIVFSFPRWSLLLSAIPLFGGVLGYFQGKKGFCVRYAMAGKYNISQQLGAQESVSDEEAMQEDRRQAKILLIRAAFTATTVAIVIFLIFSL
ncbi:MAG: hypothetical protein ABEI06_05855 [Halobacteriaceae archaeon]